MPLPAWRRYLAALINLSCLFAFNVRAEIPADRRAQLVLKALSYNRSIRARAADEIPFAILTNGAGCHDTVAALQATARKTTVAGRPVKVVVHAVPAGNLGALEEALVSAKILAVFACPELTSEIPRVVALTRKLDIMSFSGLEAHIEGGIALGVVERGSRPAILTNMTAIREEGVDLDSALMRFAGTMR